MAKIASVALKPSHQFITTLKEEDSNTHEHVTQEVLIADFDDILAVTYEVLRQQKEKGDFKSESGCFSRPSLVAVTDHRQSWSFFLPLEPLVYITKSSPTSKCRTLPGRFIRECHNPLVEKLPKLSGMPKRGSCSVRMSLLEVSMSRESPELFKLDYP